MRLMFSFGPEQKMHNLRSFLNSIFFPILNHLTKIFFFFLEKQSIQYIYRGGCNIDTNN